MDREFMEDLEDPDIVRAFIKDWNESRLDMFALSPPNENLEFSGVMRFYFQDRGQKAATKCIRVNNRQTVADVMATLIEKFCPDMKMLSTPNYELYEIHGTGDVRKLALEERPLVVQLLWHNDDREGRFVLKSADLKIQPAKFFEVNQDEGQLKRRLSRREKKDLKKKRKEQLKNRSEEKLLADHVYRELPESSFTRTISNPEAVMRRRRQQKLEKRMKEFNTKGGPQTGGILKIFAESLKPEIPYKTILASVKDNADIITKSALEKFLLGKEDPDYYCIVMAIIPHGGDASLDNAKERIIRSSDCPLAIQNSWPKNKGLITFHLRRRAQGTFEPKPEKAPPKDKSVRPPQLPEKPKQPPPNVEERRAPNISHADVQMRNSLDDDFDRDVMPYFLELTPEGKEINYKPKIYYIKPQETIIGSSRNPTPGVQYLQLFSPKILASHCSIVNADGTVSIVPHGPEADVRVGGEPVYDNTLLQTGDVVQFGGLHTFRFCNPLDFVNESPHESPSLSRPDYPYNGYNKSFTTPPISPELKERILNEQIGSNIDDSEDDNTMETTFGVDGEVETNKTKKQMYAAHSAENLLGSEPKSIRESFKSNGRSAPNLSNLQDPSTDENLLPASLSFLDHGKDAFFATVTSEVNGSAVSFKLAPTYTLYLAARHLLSPTYRPGLNPADRSRAVASITKRIATSIQQTIQENDCLAGGLAFWMANASELLHFYRQDIDLGPITEAAQVILAQSIQESFALLVNAMEEELSLALPAFLDPTDSVDILPRDLDSILNDDLLERAESMELLNWTTANADAEIHDPRIDRRMYTGEQWITPAARIRYQGMPKMADVLYILSSAMSLLRRCRVNAALTIQLFSQLFHFINMWTFNRIVLEPDLKLCTRLWGHCLRMRLSFIEAWAERQGLELAADCHLARVIQAAHLLEATKDSAEAIADVASACFKLNSLQLRTLLENYLPEMDEPIIPQELIDSIVSVAESTADELTQSDGREVKLDEDIQLQLPFLLPEEGYSSDIIRGVPPGLQEFLEPLCNIGVCDLTFNPQSHGLWTVYQVPYNRMDEDMEEGERESQVMEELPIQRITIDKGKSGLGLSICATKGAQSDFTGIYIKAVIIGGIAAKDGRLEAGDQILSVNESSLIDVSQQQAAKIMGKSGSVITLEVMKKAAFYHGLAKLVEGEISLSQASAPALPAAPKVESDSGPPSSGTPESSVPQHVHTREKSNDSGKSRSDDDMAPPRHAAPPPPAHRKQKSTDSGKSAEEEPPPAHAAPPPPAHRKKKNKEGRKSSRSSESSDAVPQHVKPPVPAHRKQKSTDSGKSSKSEESEKSSKSSKSSKSAPPPVAHRKQKSTDSSKSSEEPVVVKKEPEPVATPKPAPSVHHSRDSSRDSGVSHEPIETNIDDSSDDDVHDYDPVTEIVPPVAARPVAVAAPAVVASVPVEAEMETLVAAAVPEPEPEPQHTESDYDSDGTLMTTEDKERYKRQKQRQREYEERLAKWEEQRKQQEESERQRLAEEEQARLEDEAEDERLRLEGEARFREEEEARRLAEEAEAQRLEAEAEETRRVEAEEAAKAEERRLRTERIEEERRLAYERIVREEKERKQSEADEEAERLRRDDEERRAIELERQKLERQRVEEQARLDAERKRLEEERKELEQKRLEEERQVLERKRAEEEAMELERKSLEEERVRLEEEKKAREEEERRAKEEVDILRKKREDDFRRAKEEEEDRKRLEEYRLEQRRMIEEREEEDRRQEKLRMIEEKKRKEEEESEVRAQRRKDEEDKRRREYEDHVERRRIEHEKVIQEAREREQREKEAEEERQRIEDEKARAKAAADKSTVDVKREEFNAEMSSLDDALREAERIAAEMDMFMMEEEQKIEEDFRAKRKQEEFKWKSDSSPISNDSASSDRQGTLSRESSAETDDSSVGADDLADYDFPPPPPVSLILPPEPTPTRQQRIETNIDSSDEEEKPLSRASNSSSSLRNKQTPAVSVQDEQQRWLSEQKEKREKYREEQERLRQDRLAREEEERRQQMKEVEARRNMENKQMEEYRKLKEEIERKEREEAARAPKVAPRPPPVKAKKFNQKNGTKPTPTTTPNLPTPPSNGNPPERRLSSDEDEAPPRPPPPKNVKSPVYSPNSRNSNGFPDFNRTYSSQTSNIPPETPPPPAEQPQGTYVKKTPEPAIVNQGVEVPEVLDFKSKMKLFGSFQG